MRLLGVRKGDLGRRRLRLQFNGAAGVREARSLVVLDDGDDGAQRIGEPRIGIDSQRTVDRGPRLVYPADCEELRGLLELEPGIAVVRRHLLECGVDHRRVVERPLHRIARADHGVWRRRLSGLGHDGMTARHLGLALFIGSRHDPLEHGDRCLFRLCPNHELGALDRGVQVGRVDLHRARLAAERLKGAEDEVQERGSFLFLADVDETDCGFLVEPQHGLIDEHDGRAAARTRPHRVTLAQGLIEGSGLPE